jgi:hypothetical protein
LVIGGGAETTTSFVVSDVVESSVESLFQWATVAESSTFGLIWFTAVIGNGLIIRARSLGEDFSLIRPTGSFII